MIRVEITRLPLQTIQVSRKRHRVLTRSGANLQDLRAIQKLVPQHFEYRRRVLIRSLREGGEAKKRSLDSLATALMYHWMAMVLSTWVTMAWSR